MYPDYTKWTWARDHEADCLLVLNVHCWTWISLVPRFLRVSLVSTDTVLYFPEEPLVLHSFSTSSCVVWWCNAIELASYSLLWRSSFSGAVKLGSPHLSLSACPYRQCARWSECCLSVCQLSIHNWPKLGLVGTSKFWPFCSKNWST